MNVAVRDYTENFSESIRNTYFFSKCCVVVKTAFHVTNPGVSFFSNTQRDGENNTHDEIKGVNIPMN